MDSAHFEAQNDFAWLHRGPYAYAIAQWERLPLIVDSNPVNPEIDTTDRLGQRALDVSLEHFYIGERILIGPGGGWK